MGSLVKTAIATTAGVVAVAAALLPQGGVPNIPPQPVFTLPADLCGYEGFNFLRSGQSANLRQSLSFTRGESAVLFRWGEKSTNPNDPVDWHDSEVVESATFAITAVTSRSGGNAVYVAGVTQNGTDVIELWNFPTRSGGFGIRQTSGPVLSLGTPMPPYTAEQYLQGGSFAVPSSTHNSARRTPFYSGTSMGHIRDMAVDPEGRFLVILAYPTGSIYRLDLSSTTSVPTLLYAASTIPHLANAKTVAVLHHASQGRKYILTEQVGCVIPLNQQYTLLADSNNDGVFESWSTITAAQWDAAGYGTDSNWVDYQNLGVTYDW